MIITTDRLRLRPMERKDIADFVRYLNDWDVQQWLSIPPFPYEEKDGEAYLAIVQDSHATDCPTAFVVADRTRDSAFGAAAINIDDQGQGELGYWFGREHWGQGFAQEAVAALLDQAVHHSALRRLVAVTDPENLRSQRVLAASGLTDCGLRNRPRPSRRGSTQLRAYELDIDRR